LSTVDRGQHLALLAGPGFLHRGAELRGLVTYYALFIRLRAVVISPSAVHPDVPWMR
jgi:hypothetical protein